jgi:hypothetical protein
MLSKMFFFDSVWEIAKAPATKVALLLWPVRSCRDLCALKKWRVMTCCLDFLGSLKFFYFNFYLYFFYKYCNHLCSIQLSGKYRVFLMLLKQEQAAYLSVICFSSLFFIFSLQPFFWHIQKNHRKMCFEM